MIKAEVCRVLLGDVCSRSCWLHSHVRKNSHLDGLAMLYTNLCVQWAAELRHKANGQRWLLLSQSYPRVSEVDEVTSHTKVTRHMQKEKGQRETEGQPEIWGLKMWGCHCPNEMSRRGKLSLEAGEQSASLITLQKTWVWFSGPMSDSS